MVCHRPPPPYATSAELRRLRPAGRLGVAGRSTGASTSAGSASAARPRQLRRASATGEPLVFIHGLAGCWQNWLENIPHFARHAPRDRARPARLRRSPRCRPRRSRSRATPPPSTSCSTSSASSAPTSSATRWAGSSAPSWRSSSRTRVERLVLVSAAGLTSQELHRDEPRMAALRRLENVLAFTTGWFASRSERAGTAAAACARRCSAMVAAHPDAAPAAAGRRAGARLGQGRASSTRSRRSTTYRSATGWSEIACPTLIVWGDDATGSSRSATPSASSRLIPELAQASSTPTPGTCAMLERPAALQRRRRGVLRRGRTRASSVGPRREAATR